MTEILSLRRAEAKGRTDLAAVRMEVYMVLYRTVWTSEWRRHWSPGRGLISSEEWISL